MEQRSAPSRLVRSATGFSALGSEQRLTVLITLVRAGPNGLPIGALGERSGITGSTLSHHVKVLAQSGLVRQRRDGRRILCAADYGGLRDLSDFLLDQCCADTAAANGDHGHE